MNASLIVPALVLAGTVGSTYLFCVRPMRRGARTMTCTKSSCSTHHDRGAESADLDADLTQARQELASLHREVPQGKWTLG